MKRNIHSVFLTSLLFFCSSLFLVLCNRADDRPYAQNKDVVEKASSTPELADYMGRLQQYTHKFTLSVAAENQEVADFYLHEMEELIEDIQKDIPEYEGHDISGLISAMLISRMEDVEASLDENNWQETRSKVVTLIDACNSCHHATDHGFLEITPSFDTNPYNQAF